METINEVIVGPELYKVSQPSLSTPKIEDKKETLASKKDSLNSIDWEAWTKETLIYSGIPIGLVFLQTMQSAFMAHGSLPTGNDVLLALGAAYGTLLAALINLLGKLKSGN